MPIDKLRKEIYLFVKEKNQQKTRVYWKPHIMLFVMKNGFTRQEGGHALNQLREKRAIFFTKKTGWVVR